LLDALRLHPPRRNTSDESVDLDLSGYSSEFGKGVHRIVWEGGRYKIVIPGRLAYGPNPPQGSPIGANEDLSFDVHVLQVARNAALQYGGGQGQ